MAFRPIFDKHCSATLSDVMGNSLEMLLKMNEYMDIKDFIEEQAQKDAEEEAKNSSNNRGRR